MRIFDENDNEITTYDMNLGYLKAERRLVAHHPEVEYVEEVWHYETIKEYPNGGEDLAVVIDIPGVEASEAWDEYEDILRYIPYTDDELTEMNSHRTPSLEDQIAELKEMMLTLQSSVQAIMAANGISLEQEIVYEE